MAMLFWIIFQLLCGLCYADYECLCSYNVEKPVLHTASSSSQVIGYMYEFDCKPGIPMAGLNKTKWHTIAFEHQIGYVEMDSQMQAQVCPGNPSGSDVLTTNPLPKSSLKTVPSTITSPATTSTAPTTTETLSSKSTFTTTHSTTVASTSVTPTTLRQSSSTSASTKQSTTTSTSEPTTVTTHRTTIRHPTTTKQTTQSRTSKIITQKATTTKPIPTTVKTTSPTTRTTTSTTISRPTTTTRPTTETTIKTSVKTTPPTTRTTTRTITSRPTTTTRPTTKTTIKTTSRRPTTITSAAQSITTSITTRQSTITTTTTTARSSTHTTVLPAQLGNTSLCPSIIAQYAQHDNEILTQMGDSCYTVVPHKMSWSHAEYTCKQRGGHLFHVDDAGQNLFFYILLNTRFNHSVWMGLHDILNEEHFQWTAGNPVSYTNWVPGRKSANHHFTENCVVFMPYTNHGQWDDIPCGSTTPMYEPFQEKHYFICQFHTVNYVGTTPNTAIQIGNINNCPSNVKHAVNTEGGHLAYHNNTCYERVPQLRTWTYAESDCERKGGRLVQIGSYQEQLFIQQFLGHFHLQHQVWIGLHDRGHEETFTWTTGESLTYTNWMPGRQNNVFSHSVEDCVVLLPSQNGEWDDISCGPLVVSTGHGLHTRTEVNPYICEYSTQNALSPTPTLSTHHGNTGTHTSCPSNVMAALQRERGHYAHDDKKCYERVPQYRTWYSAEHDCQGKGGHLLTVSNSQEETFILQFLARFNLYHQVWIGLHDRGHEETFTWASGEQLTYTNWMPGRKSNHYSHYVEDCAVLDPSKHGQWDDITCGSFTVYNSTHRQNLIEVNPYICEYNAVPATGAVIIGK